MFPRSLRLSRTGFSLSRALSRRSTPHFSLSYGSLPQAAGIGVIVPKKVAKSSVERHALKRRVREIAREAFGTAPGSRTLVITARADAQTLRYEELRKELSEAIKDILLGTNPS